MTYTKTCPVCGKEYSTDQPTRIYCGLACEEEMAKRRGLERRRQEREALKGTGWRVPRPCRICGEMFMPKSAKNTCCPKPECRREDNRRRMHERQDEKTRQAAAIEALERGENGSLRNLDWRKGAICPICGRKFIPKQSTNRICPDPACKLALTRQNAAKGNQLKRQKKAWERAEMLREAQACIVQPAKGKEMPLAEAIRMPEKPPEPKRRKRKPKAGSLEWCAREADRRGMSYGKFVAAMEQGVLDP